MGKLRQSYTFINSIYCLLLGLLLSSCGSDDLPIDQSKTVQVIHENGKYQLYRHGKPYFIKGASGDASLKMLKRIGGNSIRTYTTENAERILNEADSLGMTVMLGIWITPYSKFNDFSDSVENERILRRIKREVLRYKDHPALLIWGIGNEVHPINPNISSWKFLERACKMVKELDPNHPVTTSIAGYPRRNITFMNMFLHSVDFVSFNTFGGIEYFEEKMANPIWGYEGGYLLSEWGYYGYWSTERTEWMSPREPFTNSKAPRFKEIWNKYILQDSLRCFGGYVFYWGQKQEFTPSWYSIFSPEGEKTAIVDTLSSIWNGKPFTNTPPHIMNITINNISDFTNLKLKPNSTNTLRIDYISNEPDTINTYAEVRHETSLRVDDYGIEKMPSAIPQCIQEISDRKVLFNAPKEPGIYRLFIKLEDGHNNCDMANIVFKVTG